MIDAAHTDQARTHLAERRPDLIITDLSLPGALKQAAQELLRDSAGGSA